MSMQKTGGLAATLLGVVAMLGLGFEVFVTATILRGEPGPILSPAMWLILGSWTVAIPILLAASGVGRARWYLAGMTLAFAAVPVMVVAAAVLGVRSGNPESPVPYPLFGHALQRVLALGLGCLAAFVACLAGAGRGRGR